MTIHRDHLASEAIVAEYQAIQNGGQPPRPDHCKSKWLSRVLLRPLRALSSLLDPYVPGCFVSSANAGDQRVVPRMAVRVPYNHIHLVVL